MRPRRSLRALTIAATLTGACLAGLTPGCKKDPESLIVVSLDASDGNGASVAVVEITVFKPAPSTEIVTQKFFDLPLGTGLPMANQSVFEVGVYIRAGVTGSLPVAVAAKPPGAGCMGYVGMKAAKINGGDTKAITLTLRPGNVCTVAGTAGMGGSMGTAGMGGSMGTAGSSGSTGTAGGGGSVVSCGSAVGTPPAPAAAPTLGNCVEYDHNAAGGTCNPDPAVDINNQYLNDVAVSPDGQLLATSGTDSNYNALVKVWRLQGNVPVGQCAVFSRGSVGPAFVAFSPDGQYFAIAWNNDYLYVYGVPDFTLVGESKSSGVNSIYGVGFSADSQTVLSIDWDGGSDGTLHADQPNGTAITQLPLGVDPDFFTVAPVAVGGLTTMAVAGYNGNFGVYTWNGSTLSGPTVRTTVAGANGAQLRFSRNGSMLAEGTNDGTIRLWSVPITASSAPNGTSIVVGDIPFGLSFSAAGDQLAVGFGSEIDLWSVATRAQLARHSVTPPAGGTSQYVDSTTFSASGSAVVVGEDKCGKFLICSD